MSVLVASPVRNASKWLDRYLASLEAIASEDISFAFLEGNSIDDTYEKLAIFAERYPTWLRRYSIPQGTDRVKRLAMLRNRIIDYALKDEDDYVFWIDSDVVKFPPTILKQLIQTNHDMIAPYVLIEGKLQFYDTQAYQMNNVNFRWQPPYPPFPVKDPTKPFQVSSVGTCYLVKRRVYDAGCRYGDTKSEQVTFCKQASDKGFQIWVDPRLVVYHANLQNYGERWH